MRNRGLLAVLLSAVLCLTSTITVLADSDGTVITYEGETKQFVIEEEGNLSKGLADMDPGEERTGTITLRNNDDNEMRFYISGEVAYNIAEEGDKLAVYEIMLEKNNREFYHGIIGSKENKNQNNTDLGLEYLEDTTLLADLKKGESVQVAIKIVLDGDSTGNSYQDKQGEIQLKINAEYKDDNKPPEDNNQPKDNNHPKNNNQKNSTKTIIKAAKTGDYTNVIPYITVGTISLIVIILLFRAKKAREEKE